MGQFTENKPLFNLLKYITEIEINGTLSHNSSLQKGNSDFKVFILEGKRDFLRPCAQL